MKNLKGIVLLSLIVLFTSSGCTGSSKIDIAEDVVSEMTLNEPEENLDLKNDDEPKDNEKEDVITVPSLENLNLKRVDNAAMQFVKSMKIGWNLGNTFDTAFENPWFDDELQYESAWNGHLTTKEMIDAIKAEGFETLRLPVSWHNHVEGDDFIISERWMNRVQEVLDYAIDNDMYVILNIHHDVHEDYYYPSRDYLSSSTTYMHRIWEQVASRFSDYDEKLIFESINEPRLVGSPNEWWLDLSKEECRDSVDVINQLNQVFVDTVRQSGGNNARRYLMVPGYSASPEGVLNELFVMPADTEVNDNKIILSVHAYRPYAFALQGPTEAGNTSKFTAASAASTNDIDAFMNELYDTYTSKGVPVVIGEFGARNKNNNLQERVEFSAYYIHAASARGITACWWDNNEVMGNGENFGLFNRATQKWSFPDIIQAMMQYID